MITIERVMYPEAVRKPEACPVLLFEGEQNAHRFLISPGPGVSFGGCSVTAEFISSDGQTAAPSAGLLDGKAAVTLTQACYAVPGPFRLLIYVSGGDRTVCAYACDGSVLASVGRSGAASEPITD